MSKKDIKSWLARQALWQVHIPPPKEIHYPHYDVTKPNEQQQFDLIPMPHNVFEGNTYRYILSGIAVASDLRSQSLLRPKNQARLHLCLEQSIRRKAACLNISRFSKLITVQSLKVK